MNEQKDVEREKREAKEVWHAAYEVKTVVKVQWEKGGGCTHCISSASLGEPENTSLAFL